MSRHFLAFSPKSHSQFVYPRFALRSACFSLGDGGASGDDDVYGAFYASYDACDESDGVFSCLLSAFCGDGDVCACDYDDACVYDDDCDVYAMVILVDR